MRRHYLPTLIVAGLCAVPASAQKGWMDVKDSPAKHPGPWLKIADTPEQAQLRKELAGAGKIVYSSNRDGNWEIYVANPDGTGQKNLTNHPGWDVYPRWTPDGKILFFSDRDSKVKLAQDMGLSSCEGTWRKGLWGLYRQQGDDFRTRDVEGLDAMPQCGIYIMDADGANVRLLVKDARRAALSRDGKFLTFERRRHHHHERNLATEEEFDAVRAATSSALLVPEFSPDGNRLLVATVGDTKGQTPPLG